MKPLAVAGIVAAIGVAFSVHMCMHFDSVSRAEFDKKYPPPWREGMNVELSRYLVQHGVTGCGQYMWRKGKSQSALYVVRCSRDGNRWYEYEVFDAGVVGPSEPTRGA